MKPTDYLEEAASLIGGDRAIDYGDVTTNHKNIAQLWSAYLNTRPATGDLGPVDVLHMMALLKIARTQQGIHKDDNYTDAAGYIALAGSVAAPEVPTVAKPEWTPESERVRSWRYFDLDSMSAVKAALKGDERIIVHNRYHHPRYAVSYAFSQTMPPKCPGSYTWDDGSTMIREYGPTLNLRLYTD